MDFDFSDAEKRFTVEVDGCIEKNRDPEVMDVTRENMSQLVDTPKRRAFMRKEVVDGMKRLASPFAA